MEGFLRDSRRSAGHSLAQAAFLEKGYFQLAQLLIQKVVGHADQSDDHIGGDCRVGMIYSFAESTVMRVRDPVQIAKAKCEWVILGPFRKSAGAQEVAVVSQQFHLAGPRHVDELDFSLLRTHKKSPLILTADQRAPVLTTILRPLGQIPQKHLPDILPALADLGYYGGLEAAVHHALGAARIFPYAVLLPLGFGHHLFVAWIMVVGDEVAGGFPAARVPGRITPGGALQLFVAFQETQVHRGRVEAVTLAHLVDLLELLLDFAPLQEETLAYRLVSETGRHQETVDADLFEMREEHVDLHQIGFLEDGGVGADPETKLFGLLDGGHGNLEGAFALQYPVVGLFHAVHVDVQDEVRVRLQGFQRFFQKERIGAEVDVLPSFQYFVDQREDVGIEKRLATGYGDDGGRTFVNGIETLLQCHHLLNGVGILSDPAAAGAGEVAKMGRLKHQHERILFLLIHLVGNDVLGQVVVQSHGKTHVDSIPF
jgi:hypothetical protein